MFANASEIHTADTRLHHLLVIDEHGGSRRQMDAVANGELCCCEVKVLHITIRIFHVHDEMVVICLLARGPARAWRVLPAVCKLECVDTRDGSYTVAIFHKSGSTCITRPLRDVRREHTVQVECHCRIDGTTRRARVQCTHVPLSFRLKRLGGWIKCAEIESGSARACRRCSRRRRVVIKVEDLYAAGFVGFACDLVVERVGAVRRGGDHVEDHGSEGW